MSAGTYITDSAGKPLEVDVVDQFNNLVTTDNATTVTIGVQANNGRGPVFVGYNATNQGSTVNDPANNAFYNWEFTGTVKAGVITFPFLYMNQVGANFILAAGTTNFAVSSSATTSNKAPSNGFSVVPGALASVKFANMIGTSNALTSFNVTGIQPIKSVNGIVVGAFDNVGNVVTGFSGAVQLAIQAGGGTGTGTLLGVTMATAFQGFAVFNQAYISNDPGFLGTYTLSATTPDLMAAATSNQFTINNPAGGFTGTPSPVLTIDQPIRDATSGNSFNITVRVANLASSLESSANIKLELRDKDGNPLPTGPFLQYPTDQQSLQPAQGSATFTVLINLPQPAVATQFTIVALLDLNAQVTISAPFTVNPLGAPTNLVEQEAPNQVALAWTASSDSSVIGYNVLRGTTSGGENSIPLNNELVTTTSFVDTDVNDGTTYFYEVEAVNGSGPGDPSNEVSATPALVGANAANSTNPIIQLGLGSLTRDFDTISSDPVYTQKPLSQVNFPPVTNFNPATITTAPAMQQPVAASGFDQVPVSSKWWSSLMFPRNTASGPQALPVDSEGNVLYPLYADPFSALVNGSEHSADCQYHPRQRRDHERLVQHLATVRRHDCERHELAGQHHHRERGQPSSDNGLQRSHDYGHRGHFHVYRLRWSRPELPHQPLHHPDDAVLRSKYHSGGPAPGPGRSAVSGRRQLPI